MFISKQTIRSTSPISNPSSPTDVDIKTLQRPALNSFRVSLWVFCVVFLLCPTNAFGFMNEQFLRRFKISETQNQYSQKTITFEFS